MTSSPFNARLISARWIADFEAQRIYEIMRTLLLENDTNKTKRRCRVVLKCVNLNKHEEGQS